MRPDTSNRPAEAARQPTASTEPLTVLVDEPVPWVLVLQVQGQLDTAGASKLRSILDDKLKVPSVHVILDLSGVSILGPAGVHLLVHTQRRLRIEGVPFSVVGTNRPSIHVPLSRTGAFPHLEILDSVASAVARANRPHT